MEGYSSDDAQYTAVINAGITFAAAVRPARGRGAHRGTDIAPTLAVVRAGHGLNNSNNVTNASTSTTLAAATLSGRNVNITATSGDITLAAAHINASEAASLSAAQGDINFNIVRKATSWRSGMDSLFLSPDVRLLLISSLDDHGLIEYRFLAGGILETFQARMRRLGGVEVVEMSEALERFLERILATNPHAVKQLIEFSFARMKL